MIVFIVLIDVMVLVCDSLVILAENWDDHFFEGIFGPNRVFVCSL